MKLTIIAVLIVTAGTSAVAQQANSNLVPPHVNWVDLHVPVYPPLAAQARIMGTVQVRLSFHDCALDRDHITVVSGHPMLVDVALNSLRESSIQCGDFRDGETIVSFEFKFDDDIACYQSQEQRVELQNNVIRIFTEARCVETTTVQGQAKIAFLREKRVHRF